MGFPDGCVHQWPLPTAVKVNRYYVGGKQL